MTALKVTLATIAAFIAGNVGITAGQAVNGIFYPSPEGMDFNDTAALAAWASTLPLPALLGVEVSYIAGSVLCGFTGAVIVPSHGKLVAGITGVLFTLGNVANVMAIPHPMWMVVMTMVTFLPLTFAGAALGAKLRPPTP